MPGTWVVFLLMFPLTVLSVLGVFAEAGGFSGHTFYFAYSLAYKRQLLGAGFRPAGILAPVMGVLFITSEYRHKTITTTLVLSPRRSQVLLGKVIVTAYWAVLMALLSLVVTIGIGIPWNAGLGGVSSQVVGQIGAVAPGLVFSIILLALFGLGFGALVKNQVAGILVTIGGAFILEPLLVVLSHQILHYDLNWLPSDASAAFAGILAQANNMDGTGRLQLLPWWAGGLAMLGWGLVPLTLGYFTTFSRDVT
jgi:ABC-type transport system involved in multi-copper enzyme maturation permease subunit